MTTPIGISKIDLEAAIATGNALLKPKGETFAIEPHMTPVLEKLIRWHNPSSTFPTMRRGYMLTGKPGSSKTTLMRIFNQLAAEADRCTFYDAQDIAVKYSQGGWPALDKLINAYYLPNGIKSHVWIDDIGTEDPVMWVEAGFTKSKMTDCIPYIVHKLAIKFERQGVRLHATTNMSEDQLMQRYDARTFSRLKGLMDWLPCGIGSDDRDFRVRPEVG